MKTKSLLGVFGVSKLSGRALTVAIGGAATCRARKVQRITKNVNGSRNIVKHVNGSLKAYTDH
eukprot:6343585-Heterocapsa_arctica.AAC.1